MLEQQRVIHPWGHSAKVPEQQVSVNGLVHAAKLVEEALICYMADACKCHLLSKPLNVCSRGLRIAVGTRPNSPTSLNRVEARSKEDLTARET